MTTKYASPRMSRATLEGIVDVASGALSAGIVGGAVGVVAESPTFGISSISLLLASYSVGNAAASRLRKMYQTEYDLYFRAPEITLCSGLVITIYGSWHVAQGLLYLAR